jgi:hypothetical protein
MAYLVAILGTGKGTWAMVSQLMRQGNFEKTILITNQFGKEKYTPDAKTALVVVNFDQAPSQLRDEIKAKLPPLLEKLVDTDVAVNMISGNGPEHMALISAILQLGLGVRLVTAEPGKQGFTEL